eukprot:gene735-2151_t
MNGYLRTAPLDQATPSDIVVTLEQCPSLNAIQYLPYTHECMAAKALAVIIAHASVNGEIDHVLPSLDAVAAMVLPNGSRVLLPTVNKRIVTQPGLNDLPLLEIIDRKDYDNLSEKHRMLLPYVVIQMSCGDSLVRGIINNRKKITGNEMIETSLKKFIESNMKWVSNKANIHVSKDGRKRIDDYKGKEYQNVIVANALLMLLLKVLVTGNDEIVAFKSLDFRQLTDRMYLQPIVTGGVQELDRAISNKRFFSLSSNTANNVYLLVIGVAFSLLQNSSPAEIVSKILFAGAMMATMQMSAIIGTEPNTVPTKTDSSHSDN